jgi:hypothetical protein
MTRRRSFGINLRLFFPIALGELRNIGLLSAANDRLRKRIKRQIASRFDIFPLFWPPKIGPEVFLPKWIVDAL